MPLPAQPLYADDVAPENDPSLDDFQAMADEAMTLLPAELRKYTGALVVRVADFPEPDVLDEMGCESPYDLLGLYQGTALTEKSFSDPAPAVDMVFLYRQPLLDYWAETGDDLHALVRNTLIHEIGHHFGFSDDEMERLEDEAAAEEAGLPER